MQIHQIKTINKNKRPKRVGRGGKRGSYSGRGIKGQNSRAGRKFQPAIRQFIKRYPKLRGYDFKPQKSTLQTTVLNLDTLDEKFEATDKITPELLLERKIIRRIKGKMPRVVILGRGEAKKPFVIEGCSISKSAKVKLEKIGGKITEKQITSNK